jgi:hypothetical protein
LRSIVRDVNTILASGRLLQGDRRQSCVHFRRRHTRGGFIRQTTETNLGGIVQKIRSVGVLSCAKMSCVIYGCLGLLFIPIALIAGLAGLASGQKGGMLGGIGLFAIAILAPVFYAALGFVSGAISALVYNLAAKWMGGIEIQLEAAAVVATHPAGLP